MLPPSEPASQPALPARGSHPFQLRLSTLKGWPFISAVRGGSDPLSVRARGLEPPRGPPPIWRQLARRGGKWLWCRVFVSPNGDKAHGSVRAIPDRLGTDWAPMVISARPFPPRA